MPQSEGQVVSIFVRQVPLSSTVLDATVTLLVKSRFIEKVFTFTLWEAPVGDCVPPSISVARSLNVSLLRVALVRKLDVIITHSDWVTVVDDQGHEIEKSFVEAVTLVAGPQSVTTA